MDDLHGQDLRWAYWYNTHQTQVRQAAYAVIIAVVSILWLINLVMIVRLLFTQTATNHAVNDIGNTQIIYDSIQAPADLTIEVVDALSHSSTTVDVYALISNPNRYHVGQFSYVLTVNGINYTFNDGLVMPAAQSYIVVSDLPGTAASTADLTITELTWERVRGSEIKAEFRVAEAVVKRSNLTGTVLTNSNSTSQNSNTSNTNSEFVRPDDLSGEVDTDAEPTGATITQVTGTLTNASAYGFRRVMVTALLRNSAGLVLGVQQQIFTDMASFSDYHLVFNWQRQFEFNVLPEVVVTTDLWHDANLILPGQD